MNQLTVIVLAAGLGTRMKSRKAKVLHEAGGLPLIKHVVRSASGIADPGHIVIVTGHQAESVESLLSGHGLRFARQQEQRGTGHAVAICENVVPGKNGRVVILYGDCPLLSTQTLRKLLDCHSQSTAAATVITTELDDPTGYGRVIVDENGSVRGIVEEKAANPQQKSLRLINSGIYCFEADALWHNLRELQPNPAANEYYLTDIVDIINRTGRRVASFCHDNADELLGINTRVDLAHVDSVFRERKARELMLSGVTIVRPETVAIDVDVQVGMDTVIEACSQLLGTTVIGENCRIGAGAIVRDCTIADNVEIGPYTFAAQSRVDSGATVGPFARLRLENHVGENALVGNFVELKKTHLGPGSKASHLTYLGDSTIGTDVNIGAGTITCNYDGRTKHKTRIGDQAFIGSNSTLVAPVEVGSGAYTAAGSVITEPVPADALGIGRGRQVNKQNWARERRDAAAVKDSSSSGDER
jgi:bifunctional UDP-N-acetylglucosamine pyrophosphorylase/glucosamine-1-phosphate N-acetyltransferase